jgi:hypothetical protein
MTTKTKIDKTLWVTKCCYVRTRLYVCTTEVNSSYLAGKTVLERKKCGNIVGEHTSLVDPANIKALKLRDKQTAEKGNWLTVCHNAPQISGQDEFDKYVNMCGVCHNIVGRETKLIKPV